MQRPPPNARRGGKRMPLITWLRKFVQGSVWRPARRGLCLPRSRWTGCALVIEALEERALLSTFQWTGLGPTTNWDDAGNWNLVSGAGTFPNASADIAQFVVPGGGAVTGQTTATVNVLAGITVGEIDFGTSSS